MIKRTINAIKNRKWRRKLVRYKPQIPCGVNCGDGLSVMSDERKGENQNLDNFSTNNIGKKDILKLSNSALKYINKDNEGNKTMFQAFEWYLQNDGQHWNFIKEHGKEWAENGINMIWLPPAYKGADGSNSVGYDVYDVYDLGEFNQKGTVRTKYGNRLEYLECVKELKRQGIYVLADIVLDHMMGADETEEVSVAEFAPGDRHQQISDEFQISAWTKYTFPGRNGVHSKEVWDHSDFSGTDWDQSQKRSGIYRFKGKLWNNETDSEFGNFDYLMGADLDVENEDTVRKVTEWGKWYLDTVGMDGFRLDAVKHIGFNFYKEWMANMRKHRKENFFMVGEYWTAEIDKLMHYLDVNENRLSLFDVPLHFTFQRAATSNGYFDMGSIFNDSVVKARPECAVTFVDNHDTQPGQSLCSFVPKWFKLHAYATILLMDSGIPCVFWGDYYGIPNDNISALDGLKELIIIRKYLAYGLQHSYFDHCDIVGFTRENGVAILMTDSLGGNKKMYVSKELAGTKLYNVFDKSAEKETIVLDEEGNGEFVVGDGKVSVWIPVECKEIIEM